MERQGGAERDDGITLGESGAEERREGAMGDGGREGIDGKAAVNLPFNVLPSVNRQLILD